MIFTEKQKYELAKKIPLGRLGTADDVSRFALFLAIDDSSYVTGSYHMIDGGITGM